MRRRTAILLYDDVEVLDFAGPFEVFSVADEIAQHTRFEVYTVAGGELSRTTEKPGPVVARNGLKIVPDHTLASAPAADVLILPGGYGARALLANDAVLDWVRRQAAGAEVVVSVCTGARLLARLGLLDGLDVTTHTDNLDEIARLAPAARVHGDRRFHDNGKILTAAGISAGIDVSLHLVARLHGTDTAAATATYMEYHWRNDAGAAR